MLAYRRLQSDKSVTCDPPKGKIVSLFPLATLLFTCQKGLLAMIARAFGGTCCIARLLWVSVLFRIVVPQDGIYG